MVARPPSIGATGLTLLVLFGVAAVMVLLISASRERAFAEGNPNPSPDLSIQIDADGNTVPDCDTRGSPPEGTCLVREGAPFTVQVSVDSIQGVYDGDSDGTAGYTGYRIVLLHPETLAFQDRANDGEFRDQDGQPFWSYPGSYTCVGSDGTSVYVHELHFSGYCDGDYKNGFDSIESTHTGALLEVDFTCTAQPIADAVSMPLGFDSYLQDEYGKPFGVDENDKGAPELLTIDCTPPWDVNGDSAISVTDIGLVVSSFGQVSPPVPPEVDVDGNGTVSIGDLGLVVSHFGD
ncbi:MAG: hypothetical protein WEE64_12785 [Dehalococcoidia bacterium]